MDLVLLPVRPIGAAWAAGEALALTRAAGLDAGSRPSWYIPPDELPKPTAAPTEAVPAAPPGSLGPAGSP